MPELERKSVALTDVSSTTEGAGGFAGYASVFGNADSYGDVVLPGAFADTISTFLKRGFNPVGHDWGGLPIAMPTVAREDNHGLYIEASFHSTQAAQDARAVVSERVAAGKDVGLSIGYSTDSYEMLSAELAHATGVAKMGDPEHFMGGYRLLKSVTLREVSLVTVPANEAAVVTGVKSAELMTFSESVDHADGLTTGLKAYADRVRRRLDVLAKEGRVLSEANRSRLMSHVESLTTIVGDLKDMHAATEPAAKSNLVLLEAEYEATRAQLMGLL